jgi:hypothetical protein
MTNSQDRIIVAGDGKIKISNLPVFSDNKSAIAAGLTAGTLYRTSIGQLMVVY